MEERYKLYNGDCLEVMDRLIEELLKQEDHVLLDNLEWGNIVDLDCIVDEYELY